MQGDIFQGVAGESESSVSDITALYHRTYITVL